MCESVWVCVGLCVGVCGRVWACVGVCGRVGLWVCGSVGLWVCGSVQNLLTARLPTNKFHIARLTATDQRCKGLHIDIGSVTGSITDTNTDVCKTSRVGID